MKEEIIGRIIGSIVASEVSKALSGIQSQLGQLSGPIKEVTIKEGREHRINAVGFRIGANEEKRLAMLTGVGRIAGGNITLEHTTQHLHNVRITVSVDGAINASHTITEMNRFRLTKPELSPIYLIEYYEDATSFGSWVSTKQATFKYTVGFSDLYFEDNYEIIITNPYSIEISLNAFIRYYLWV